MQSSSEKKPVYIITGATGGIGSALCARLNEMGAALMLAATQAEDLKAAAASLSDAQTFAFDARKPAEFDRLLHKTMEVYGRIDGIAHCAGTLAIKPLAALSDEEVEDLIAVNLTSAVYLLRAVHRILDRHQPASIVLLGSAAGQYGLPNQEAISAAKGGVTALARSAAASLAPTIRVNTIAPGLIETPLTEPLRDNKIAREASRAMFPTATFGSADEVAAAIAFLLDGRYNFITGQTWGVDGGLSNVYANHTAIAGSTPKRSSETEKMRDKQVQFAESTST